MVETPFHADYGQVVLCLRLRYDRFQHHSTYMVSISRLARGSSLSTRVLVAIGLHLTDSTAKIARDLWPSWLLKL